MAAWRKLFTEWQPRILRRIASRGEPGVTTVLKYWLQKIVYKDFDVQENTTSVQTVFHAAKAVPDLVQPGDTEVVEILRGKVFDLLNLSCSRGSFLEYGGLCKFEGSFSCSR